MVANRMSSFWRVCHSQKVFHHRISTYPAAGIHLSSVVHWITGGTLDASSRGFAWYGHQIWGINLLALCLLIRVWHRNMDIFWEINAITLTLLFLFVVQTNKFQDNKTMDQLTRNLDKSGKRNGTVLKILRHLRTLTHFKQYNSK